MKLMLCNKTHFLILSLGYYQEPQMLNKWFNWWWNFIPSINWCFAIKHLGIKKCSTAKETVLPRDVNPFLSILTVPMARSNIHVGIVTCTLGFVQKSLFFIFIIGVLYLRKFISNEYDDFFSFTSCVPTATKWVFFIYNFH